MRESAYQAELIRELKVRFPGSIVIKNDEQYQQGFPDLLILWKDMWAALEVKTRANAPEQPNQRYFVELLDSMSFAAFIYPEIEREVLDDLQQAFSISWQSRVS